MNRKRKKTVYDERPMIAIVGETASGKSGLAMEIARRYDGEIISADSRTIYKGMDVGTAKPSKKEREEVPHYGLDLVEPGENYSAAQFQAYAKETLQDIKKRGKLPVLVGGTGLYIDAVLFNYSFSGEKNAKKRSNLNDKNLAELNRLARDKGFELSPSMQKNKRHLVRLLERGTRNNDVKKAPYNTLTLGIRISRTQLRQRIEQRVERMFRQGLRKEYNELLQKYGIENEAMSGIGYREFIDFERGDVSMAAVKRHIVKNTIKLAKRQRTWFKRNPYIEWVDSPEQGIILVDKFLKNQ